jgi:CheY-like chemotaxis protein
MERDAVLERDEAQHAAELLELGDAFFELEDRGEDVGRDARARVADGERFTDLRLVALSGYAQPEDVARATEAGFDAHVGKPPDPERLERLLAC